MRHLRLLLTIALLTFVASCGRSEVAGQPKYKTQTHPPTDPAPALLDQASKNTSQQGDMNRHASQNNDPGPPHAEKPVSQDERYASNGDPPSAPHARPTLDRGDPSTAVGDGPRVNIVAVPGHGKPAVARRGPGGIVHLLYDSPDGPQYVNSTDGGLTFGAPIAVVDRRTRKPGLEFGACDLAVDQDGRVHVAMATNAWQLKLPVEEWGFFYARLEPGAEAFSNVRNINRTPSEGFSLACDDHGNVAASWLSGKLYATVSHDSGKTFGESVELDPTLDPCNCCTTSSTYGADGTLAVLYREETNNDRDMYLVLWDQSRNRVTRTRVGTTTWKVDACPMSYYSISRDGDGFVAVWPTEGQIYLARLDDEGNSLPGAAEIRTPGRSGMRTGMLALCAPDGSTLVAWKKENELGWQLYDAQGRPAGSAGSAASNGSGVAGVVGEQGEFVLFR